MIKTYSSNSFMIKNYSSNFYMIKNYLSNSTECSSFNQCGLKSFVYIPIIFIQCVTPYPSILPVFKKNSIGK